MQTPEAEPTVVQIWELPAVLQEILKVGAETARLFTPC